VFTTHLVQGQSLVFTTQEKVYSRPTRVAARPDPWFMFTAELPDFRKPFNESFNTNVKNVFRRIKYSRIWSSTQDYAVLVLLLNIVETFISAWPEWSGVSFDEMISTSLSEVPAPNGRGRPVNIFTWFIRSSGWKENAVYRKIKAQNRITVTVPEGDGLVVVTVHWHCHWYMQNVYPAKNEKEKE